MPTVLPGGTIHLDDFVYSDTTGGGGRGDFVEVSSHPVGYGPSMSQTGWTISNVTSPPTSAACDLDVPSTAAAGDYIVELEGWNGSDYEHHRASFTVIRPPTITSFAPDVGIATDEIVITGQYFTGTASVELLYTPVDAGTGTESLFYVVDSDTQITATLSVPSGESLPAYYTCQFKVTNADGDDTSADNIYLNVLDGQIPDPTPNDDDNTTGAVYATTPALLPGVSSYDLQAYVASSWVSGSTALAGETQGSVSGLDAGSVYPLRLIANDINSGTHEGGGGVDGYTLCAAVSDFDVGLEDNDTALFYWTDVTGAASYNLYTSSNAGVTWTLVGNVAVNAYHATVADDGLTRGLEATYCVRAVNGVGYESADSNTVPFALPPLEPTGVSVTPYGVSNAYVSWTVADYATGYDIERSGDSGSTWDSVVDATAGPYYIDSTTLDDGSYLYRVRSVKSGYGSSDWVVSDAVGVYHSPVISGIMPDTGPIGTTVAIFGSHLDYVTSVRFNGTEASSFEIVGSTQINAIVAAGTTTGTVVAENVSGSEEGPSFTVTGATAYMDVCDVIWY